MMAIRSIFLCAILLYLPAGISQTPGAGPEAPTETQNAPAAAEGAGAGETAGAVTGTTSTTVTPPADVATPPPGDTDDPATAPAATPETPAAATPAAPQTGAAAPATAPAVTQDADAPVTALPAAAEEIAAPADVPATPADASPVPAVAVTDAVVEAPETAEATTDTAAEASAAPGSPAEAPASSPGTVAAPATQVPAPVEFSAVRPYLVVVKDGMDAAARQTPGFSISDQGHILTYSGELRARDSYLVSIAGGQIFTAALLDKDEDTGLMLLRIAEGGHGLGALKFATTALVPAAPLYAIKFDPAQAEPFTPVAGTVSRLEIDEEIPVDRA